jgi:AcrR family transcriptional regulator
MSPRGEELNRSLRDRSRRNILAAALRLFAERGFADTSMADVARAAGVSKGLAYNYFGSKEEILEAIVERRLAEQLAEDERLAGAASPAERLSGLIDGALARATAEPEAERLLMAVMLRGDAAPAIQTARERLKGRLLAAWREREELFAALGAEDPAREALFFGAVLAGLAFTALASPAPLDLAPLAARLREIYLDPGGRLPGRSFPSPAVDEARPGGGPAARGARPPRS